MWLSKRLRQETGGVETAADLGVTTIGGERSGVYARGEVRDLPVCSAGGVVWQPKSGDEVLVLKGGPGGEEQCVLGVQLDALPVAIQDGEVYLYSAGASVHICNDGTIDLKGNVLINGMPYVPCSCALA